MNIGIYGLGRFGSLLATMFSHTYTVLGYDLVEDISPPENVRLCSREELFTADTVFFAVPISSFEEVIRQSVPLFREGQTICDTCSVKLHPVEVMKRLVPDHCNILATHPLFGPDSVQVMNRSIILHPVRCPESLYAEWQRHFQDLGIHVISMDPDRHDFEMAYTQGITHFIGRVLEPFQSLHPTTSHGYQQVLQVIQQTCNDTLQLFLDLHSFNPHSKKMRQDFHKSLNSVIQLIDGYKATLRKEGE